MISQNPEEQVKNLATKLLSIRMHAKKELENKLNRRFPGLENEKIIQRILNRLEELKVLNDEHFGEIFLDNLIRYKTFGYYGLLMKLKSRGIEDDLAKKLIAQKVTLDVEFSIAWHF